MWRCGQQLLRFLGGLTDPPPSGGSAQHSLPSSRFGYGRGQSVVDTGEVVTDQRTRDHLSKESQTSLMGLTVHTGYPGFSLPHPECNLS